MNYIFIAILALAVVLLAIYILKSFKKISDHQMPFLKAFNPMYSVADYNIDLLKTSIAPILTEIDNKNIANFMNKWKNKFEHNTLTVEDVKFLNAQNEASDNNLLAGILALHPNATEMYHSINDTLIAPKEVVLEEEMA